jgi:hypothetical protein
MQININPPAIPKKKNALVRMPDILGILTIVINT